MAGHHLIEEYLARLSRRLPAATVDELADGLIETWRQQLATGLAPAAAARAAIAEFGSPELVTEAFVAQAPGRRVARALLVTGPIAGACWGSGLVAARAWRWPVPALLGRPATVALLALALLTAVCALAAAASSRHSYRRTRWGPFGALGIAALDAIMVAVVLFGSPGASGLMPVAITASIVRITLVMYSMPSQLMDLRRGFRPHQS